MNRDTILQITGATQANPDAVLQTLWSGYGEIVRYRLSGAEMGSVIVKHISPPGATHHPRGWNTDRSHQRKLQSYRVESHWYQHWAGDCDKGCRVAACLSVIAEGDEQLLILEDLDAAGFSGRRENLADKELHACLAWLAHFHARFMGADPSGLWPIGCYWHLDTRPDEWAAMADGPLKQKAEWLDQRLNDARFKTLVHGDAKVANFCFSTTGEQVAAVDFQYVGGGCGMRDVIYLLSSCLDAGECERLAEQYLDSYFSALRRALVQYGNAADFPALEREWRGLYAVAWADFCRFLQGWMPGHWKLNRYNQRLVEQALASLDTGAG